MLSIQNVSIQYGSKSIVRNISIDIPAGRIVALIGPNGSGKTTLVRGVSGLLRLESGKVSYRGRDLQWIPETERAKIMAVVPQITRFPPGFTVYETVSLGRTPYLEWSGRLSERDANLVEIAMEDASVSALRDKDIQTLSGGEQQRVILARALAQDTPVLMLDEPTAHLDLTYQIGLLSIVRRICEEKKLSVLVVLHDLNLAARFADEVAIMNKGKLIAQGLPSEVLTESVLSPIFRLPMAVFHPTELNYPVILPQ